MIAVLRGARRPVRMRLNEALVREARELTPDLSETVETLLAAYIDAERLKRTEKERQIENTIDFAIAHFDEFGVIGAEYAPN
jgi:antitoxin CcdA